ncbi:hypothetical protein [Sphingomonas sp. Leaf4]|uniref:hypothetical protein n=1 Tax=Sphingomonas sp. Leaf4 TaxID=2876553 RepID=UPI001E3DF8B0|nr:hypothetical protein [Sphingomonas sp. Leaf4]
MPLAAAGDEADRRHRLAPAVVVDEIGTTARIEVAPAHQPAAADVADHLGIARDEPCRKDACLDPRRIGTAVRPFVLRGRRAQRQANPVVQPSTGAQQRFEHRDRAGLMDRPPTAAFAHVPQVEPADDDRPGRQVDHGAGAETGDELRLAQRRAVSAHVMSPAPLTVSPVGPRGLTRTPGSTSRMLHPA